MPARLLSWTADPPATRAASHLAAFRTLVLVHCAVQSWSWTIVPPPPPVTFPPAAIAVSAALLSGLALASLLGRGQIACLGAVPIVALQLAWLMPFPANHNGLAFVLLGLCAGFDLERRDDERTLLEALRWVAVIVFFWAGAQKFLHGLYFRGEFLAWLVAQGTERWADVFGWMIPADELARLRAYAAHPVFSGPYRVDSWLFVLVANSVWIGEVAIAVGLLFQRTRHACGLAAIALVFAIQTAPREFMFALLYTNLLLLCVRGDWNRRLLYVFVAVYVWLVAALLGAPGAFLLRGSGSI